MYGAQALNISHGAIIVFENDVEMYGAQAKTVCTSLSPEFENDVEMYGAQALSVCLPGQSGLRMMQKCMVLKHFNRQIDR